MTTPLVTWALVKTMIHVFLSPKLDFVSQNMLDQRHPYMATALSWKRVEELCDAKYSTVQIAEFLWNNACWKILNRRVHYPIVSTLAYCKLLTHFLSRPPSTVGSYRIKPCDDWMPAALNGPQVSCHWEDKREWIPICLHCNSPNKKNRFIRHF